MERKQEKGGEAGGEEAGEGEASEGAGRWWRRGFGVESEMESGCGMEG